MRSLAELAQHAAAIVREQRRGLGERTLVDTSGGGGAAAVIPVKVKRDGGTEGTRGTQCTFTYSIWPLSASTSDVALRLATGLVPESRRLGPTVFGKRVQAADDSVGLASYATNSAAWRLIVVENERTAKSACA